MKPAQHRWKWAACPAILGIVTGIIMVVSSHDPIAIGGVVAGFSTLALCMTSIRKWVTDTAEIRKEYRAAIREADEAREAAQLATALTMGERERARSEAAAAKAEAQQAQVNCDQRALAAERRKAEETEAAIADETNRLRLEVEEMWATVKSESFEAGVIAAMSGQIDMLVLDAPDADVIELDGAREERRPTGTDNGRITRP